MTDTELAAIRERCEAATPGPFDIYVHGDNAGYTVAKFDDNGEDVFWTFSKKDDAEFIAAARSDVPALLDEVARLRGLLGRAAQESCDHVLGRYAAQTDAKDGDA